MARVVSEIIDVYVFRRRGATAEYLLLRRSASEVLGGTWQAVHGRIRPDERAYEAAIRELKEETGFSPHALYQIDAVNSFYQARDDTVHLCPCFAAEVETGAEPTLNAEHDDFAWHAYDDVLERFLWPGQRRAVEEIEREIVGRGPALPFLRIDTG